MRRANYRTKVNRDEAYKWGELRQRAHRGISTERFYEDENKENVLGVAGELAFEAEYGYQMLRDAKAIKDDGADFHTALGTVDVKTTSNPFPYFIMKDSDFQKGLADFVIQAWFKSEDSKEITIEWRGFVHGIYVADWPIKDFGYNLPTRYFPSKEIKPMWIFDHLLDWAERLNL